MAKLKVFGGLIHIARGQARTIVAATSQEQAAMLVGETLGSFRGWWAETGNQEELEVALAHPGQVFQSSGTMEKDFRPVVLQRGSLVAVDSVLTPPTDL